MNCLFSGNNMSRILMVVILLFLFAALRSETVSATFKPRHSARLGVKALRIQFRKID